MTGKSMSARSVILSMIGMCFYWPLLRRDQINLLGLAADGSSHIPVYDCLPFIFIGVCALAMLLRPEYVAVILRRSQLVLLLCVAAAVTSSAVLLLPAGSVWYPGVVILRSASFAAAFFLLTFAWGRHFSAISGRNAIPYLSMSFAMSFVVTLPRLLPDPYVYVIPLIAPLCSGLAWFFCLPSEERATDHKLSSYRKLPLDSIGILIAFLLFGSVIRGLLYAGEPSVTPSSAVLWTPGISLACSFAVVALSIAAKRSDRLPGTIWTVFAVVIFAGLFWVAEWSPEWSYVGAGAIIAGRTFFGFFLFATLVTESHRAKVSYLIALWLFIATEFVSGMLTYAFVPLLISSFSLVSVEHIGAYSLAVALMLIVCCFVFYARGRPSAAGQEQVPMASFDDTSIRIQLTVRYELTEREVDVLLLLSHGHNYKRIGQVLYISPNTVLSHTKRIYKKLGIHTKQQLIDLVTEEDRIPVAGVDTGSVG